MRLHYLLKQFYKILSNHRQFLVFFPLGIVWVTIFTLSSLPSPITYPTINLGDKIDHFFAFFVLSILLSLSLHFQNKYPNLRKRIYFYTFVITISYGIFDELHQLFIPGRFFDLLDLLADFIGTITGIYLVKLLFHKNIYGDEIE